MKRFFPLLLAFSTAFAQTSVQKGAGNVISNGPIVIGNANSLTATGNGSIIATGGTASSLPWSGLTAIPSPTLTWTGDATGAASLSASAGVSNALTLATVNANVGSFGDSTHVGAFTVNGKGLATAASNVLITPAASSITGILSGAQGGSGIANTGTTFTRAGNVAFSGAFGFTGTLTGTTTVTFPTSGTLATTSGSVASITGTAGQILANGLTTPQTGAVTLTLPSAITGVTSITGNADTATKLATARAINSVNFDGSAPITVTAAAGTLTGTTLNSTVTASSLTSVGTISTGVWNGTAIANANLANSSVTYGTTTVALGSSSTSIAGLTGITLASGNFTDTVGGMTIGAAQINRGGNIELQFPASGNVRIGGNGSFPVVFTSSTGAVTGLTNITYNGTLTDTGGGMTIGSAQINRSGNAVEIQFPGANNVRFFGNTGHADTFTASDGSGSIGGNLTVTGVRLVSTDTLSGVGAISVTKDTTKLTSTGSAQALTLADGLDGQLKHVIHDVAGGSMILTPSTKTGFSTITFTSAGDSVTLEFITTRGWIVVGSKGVTITP